VGKVTLLDSQVAEIERELTQLLASADNKKRIEEYGTATTELLAIGGILREAVERRETLRRSEEDFQLGPAADVERPLLKRLTDSLAKVRQAWDEDRVKIRQGGAVGKLRTAAETFAQRVDGNSTQRWESWRKEAESQFGVAEAQLESIKHVMDFRDQVSRYRQLADDFRAATQVVPRTPEALASIRATVRELNGIKSGLKFDLPAEVTAFFEALDRDGSFPLGKMVPTVERWLADNNGFRDLVIARRPMVRR
jgi:hypothetical protein